MAHLKKYYSKDKKYIDLGKILSQHTTITN